MSTERIYPKSDEDRLSSLTNMKARKDGTQPVDAVFTIANGVALDALQPIFANKLTLMLAAEELYHEKVAIFDAILAKTERRSAHGLHLANIQIDDEIAGWPPSVRSSYNLPLGGKVPPIKNEQDVVDQATNFINGETARVAAGGTALVDINKAEIQTLLTALNVARLARQAAKNALQVIRTDMITRREAADLLIPALWGDIDHAALKVAVGSRREFSETWGILYKNIKETAIINAKAVDSVSGIIIRGVNLSIGPLKGKRTTVAVTNDYGVAEIETHKYKETFLIAENPNYEPEYTPIELKPGESVSIVIRMKYKAII